jgi:hypothetical protein
MKQFLVEESERIEILQKHKSLLKEGTVTDTEKLDAGHRAGCFGTYPVPNGKIGMLPSGQAVFSKPSKSKPGEFVRFLPNNTYYFYNPTTKQSTQAFKNQIACPAMENLGKPTEDQVNNEYLIAQYKKDKWATLEDLRKTNQDTREINNPQIWEVVTVGNVKLYRKIGTATGTMDEKEAIRNQWVKKLRDEDGIIVNPTDVEKDKYQSVELYKINYSGLPEGLFSPNQLVYLDPTKADPSLLKDKQENESMDRKGCKETIERFYNEFQRTKGRQITNRGLITRMHDQAQFCKNEFEGKWGIGGGKFDEMIKVLSGRRTGGPSSSGDDSIFRLQ